MPRVKIRFAPPFSATAGRREMLEDLSEGFSLEDLLRRLGSQFGGDFKDLVKDHVIHPEVLVLYNGKPVREPQTTFQEGDTLLLALPIGGGALKGECRQD